MKLKGFVLIHRNIKNWEWYDHPATRLIFEHCLYSANYEDENWRGQIIKRGQFPTSIEKLAIANGLTNQQTRTALKNLQTTNEINIQTTNKYSIITVLNWDLYQPNQQTKNICNQQTNNMHLNKQIGGSNNNTIINKKINNNKIISLSNNKKNISEKEREILKKYLLNKKRTKPIEDIDAYISLLVKNGDVQLNLNKAIKWQEKQEKKKQELNVAAAEKIEETTESKEDTQAAFAEFKKAVKKIRKGN